MINKLFALSLVVMVDIGGMAISNIIYYFYVFSNGYSIKKDSSFFTGIVIFFMFLIWVTISTFTYIICCDKFDSRVLLKYLFVFQYIILLIPIQINKNLFELTIYRIVILFSIVFSTLFFFLSFKEGLYFDLLTKSWAYEYIPGFPNSLPLILIFALWISFRNKFSIFGKILIYFSLYLTLSRGGQLIAFFVSIYFIFKNFKILINIKYRSFVIFIIIILLIFIYYNGDLLNFEYLYDINRLDLYEFAFNYIEQRPVIGYGGNTLDQLRDVYVSYAPTFEWEHTHNWILEYTLRYGFVGVSLFILYLGYIFINIKSLEIKFMFIIYIFYAFFQTFMQNFIYIFILSYFATYDHNRPNLKEC